MEKAISNSSDLFGCTNCSNDNSQVQWTLTFASVITLSTISIAGAIVGTLGNGLVLLAITRNVKFRSVPDFLIFSLSTADLIVSAIYVPFHVKNLICFPVLKDSATYNMIMKFVGKLALLASIVNVVGITIDRLTAIRWPLRYHKLMTKKFAFSYISFAWLTSAIIAAVFSFAETNQEIFLGIYCMTLLLATIFMYSYILRVAHAQRIRIIAMVHGENQDRFSKQTPDCLEVKAAKILKERKAARTFSIVVGAFVVTWIPLIFYSAIAPWSESWYYEGFEWAKTFSLWNSFLNPYIYFARSKRYRQTALQMLQIVKCWPCLPARWPQVGVEIYGETTPNS
ncbi:melanocortin receptor 3-like [Stylophora pistillata]|uniref:melanocortin receptor 3-like n=1 Tax=Stylophora pistillata TaxID=50429 RepID=UPI000C039373|nr:melanocortin receptor 3-like [Stylophora pistillata]